MKHAVVLVVTVIALAAPARAVGGTADVVLGSDTATLTAASDGGQTADIDLTNISGIDQTVAPKASGNCHVTPKTIAVPAGYTTGATLTFPASCDTGKGATISLVVQPPSTQEPLALSLQPAAGTPPWRHVGESFILAFAVALALMLVIGVSFWRAHPRPPARQHPQPKTPLGGELKGLGTGWTFKDNWVGNVTVGVTALVALFSSATLGDAVSPSSKPTLAAMAVGAAIGAIFVALGPLILKLVGPDTEIPTVGGTLLAAFVTVGGAIGQVTALTWLAWELASGGTRWGVLLVGAIVGVVTLAYVARTLWHIITTGAHAPRTPRSDTLVAADEIAAAILTAKHVEHAVDRATHVMSLVRGAPAEVAPENQDALEDVHSTLDEIRNLVSQQAESRLNAEPQPLRTALL